MRKDFLLLFAILTVHINTSAQLYKPGLPATVFMESRSRIVQDLPNNYYRVQGEQLPSQEDVGVFRSAVMIPDAKHCVIYRFYSKEDTTASWQALMYEGDNYNECIWITFCTKAE